MSTETVSPPATIGGIPREAIAAFDVAYRRCPCNVDLGGDCCTLAGLAAAAPYLRAEEVRRD